MLKYDIVAVIWQNVADIKKLKQAGICTIKVSWLYTAVIADLECFLELLAY